MVGWAGSELLLRGLAPLDGEPPPQSEARMTFLAPPIKESGH